MIERTYEQLQGDWNWQDPDGYDDLLIARQAMNPVDLMNHTLSALTDSQKPKRPDPPYDRVCRVEVTVEILVPVWADGDEDGWNVTMAPESEWKLATISERTRGYIEEQCQQEVDEADCRRKRDDYEARRDYDDGKGDWLYEQRKDRES